MRAGLDAERFYPAGLYLSDLRAELIAVSAELPVEWEEVVVGGVFKYFCKVFVHQFNPL